MTLREHAVGSQEEKHNCCFASPLTEKKIYREKNIPWRNSLTRPPEWMSCFAHLFSHSLAKSHCNILSCPQTEASDEMCWNLQSNKVQKRHDPASVDSLVQAPLISTEKWNRCLHFRHWNREDLKGFYYVTTFLLFMPSIRFAIIMDRGFPHPPST